jgi:hypothetical protein
VKGEQLQRAANWLDRRERMLREEFLRPVAKSTSYTPHDVDKIAAYVGLLHSEAEHTLERFVGMLLDNARLKSVHYHPDPVLINSCLYYGFEMDRCLGKIGLVPKRDELASNKERLVEVWEELGARRFYMTLVARNHGAGINYVERLFHPLGVMVTKGTFRKLSSAGVTELVDLGASTTTMVTEFVVLRGGAVHAGTAKFTEDIRSESPQAIGTRGRGVVEFVAQTAQTLRHRVW